MFGKKICLYSALIVVFILCGVIAYSNTINSFFLCDDFNHIKGVKSSYHFWPVSDGTANFLRPLYGLSIFIDYKLWNLNPTGYHLTNIFLHSLSSFFVFLISFLLLNKTRFLKEKIWYLSLFSGLIFLLLPSHSESVAWISGGRGTVIAAFFCLASFCMYLFYKQYSEKLYLILSFLLFAVALLCKESVITYPLLILSYEIYSYIVEENKDRKFIRALYLPLFYFILFFFYLFVRKAALGTLVGGYGSRVHLNFDILLMIKNLILYSARTFLPPMPKTAMAIAIFIGAGALFLIAMFIIKSKRWSSPGTEDRESIQLICFLIIAHVILLLPVINLGLSSIDSQNERFIYLSSAFLSIFIILLLNLLLTDKRYFLISFLCLVSFFGISLYRANKNWSAAGEISKGILSSLATMGSADSLFVIGLPDNINGAYIYRNGFQSAIFLANINQFKNIIVISHDKLYAKDDAVSITRRMNDYSVRLSNPKAYFIIPRMQVNDSFAADYYEMLNFKRRGFDLRFKKLNKDDILSFYAAGKVVKYEF